MNKNLLFTSLVCAATSATAASIGSPLDSENSNKFDGVEIIDAVAVPADSPIAENNVKNNGSKKVTTIFLVDDGGTIKLIFQGEDGTTKTRNNIQAPSKTNDCGIDVSTGNRFTFGDHAELSEDGGLLVAEGLIKIRGKNEFVPSVVVWTVEPNGNSGGDAKGGKILCMEEFAEVQSLRDDKFPGHYLIDGVDKGGNATTYIVER